MTGHQNYDSAYLATAALQNKGFVLLTNLLAEIRGHSFGGKEKRAITAPTKNWRFSGYMKLCVPHMRNFVVADSLVLRNRPLFVAAKH